MPLTSQDLHKTLSDWILYCILVVPRPAICSNKILGSTHVKTVIEISPVRPTCTASMFGFVPNPSFHYTFISQLQQLLEHSLFMVIIGNCTSSLRFVKWYCSAIVVIALGSMFKTLSLGRMAGNFLALVGLTKSFCVLTREVDQLNYFCPEPIIYSVNVMLLC